jgi:hypothetical protein
MQLIGIIFGDPSVSCNRAASRIDSHSLTVLCHHLSIIFQDIQPYKGAVYSVFFQVTCTFFNLRDVQSLPSLVNPATQTAGLAVYKHFEVAYIICRTVVQCCIRTTSLCCGNV